MSASTPPGSQSDLSQSERKQERPDATRPSLYQRPSQGSSTSLSPTEGLSRSARPSGGPYSSPGGGAGALSSSSLPSSAQPPPLPPPSVTRSAVPLHPPPPPPPSLPRTFSGPSGNTGSSLPLAAQSYTTSPLPMPPASFTPGLSSSASMPTSRPPSSPFSAPSIYPSPSAPTSRTPRSPSAPGSGSFSQPQSFPSSASQPSSMSMYRPPSSASPSGLSMGPSTPATSAVSNSQAGSQSMSLPSRPVTTPGSGTPYPVGGTRFAVSNSAVDYSRSPAQQSIHNSAPATFGASPGSQSMYQQSPAPQSIYQQSPAAPSTYQQSPAAPSTYQPSPAPPVTFRTTSSTQYPGRPTPIRKTTHRGDVFVATDPFKTSASSKHDQVGDDVTFDDIPVAGQPPQPPPRPTGSGRPTSGTHSVYGSTPHSSAPMSQSATYSGPYSGTTPTSRPSAQTPSSSGYTRPQSSSAPGYVTSPVYTSQPTPSISYGGSSSAPAYYGSPSQSQSQPIRASSPPSSVPAMYPSQPPIVTPVQQPPMHDTSPMPMSSGNMSSSVPADSGISSSTPLDPIPSSPRSSTPGTEQPASQTPRPSSPYNPPTPYNPTPYNPQTPYNPSSPYIPPTPYSRPSPYIPPPTTYDPPTPYNPPTPFIPPIPYDPNNPATYPHVDSSPYLGYPPIYTSPFPDAYNNPYDQPRPGSPTLPNSPIYPPGPLWTRPDSIKSYESSFFHRVLTTLAWIFCLPCMFLLRRRKQKLGGNYSAPMADDLGEKPTDSKVVLTYIVHTFPRQAYLHMLLRLPELYFSRVARIFEEADLSLPEIKKMALETASKGKETHSIHMAFETSSVPPAYESLKHTWESFIDCVMREWKTFNVISVLLLSAILTILQIQSAADDPVVRYSSLFSLICALFSLLFGCMYIIRFGSMRKTYKAAEWALEAKKSRTVVLWNVWILLAMPAIWLTWSLILYIFCIMAFIWRSGTDDSTPPTPLSKRATLGIRITITVVVAIGAIYGFLILNTFKRYGSRMDKAWKERIDGWLDEKAQQQQDGQGPNPYSGVPTSPVMYHPPPDRQATYNSDYQTPYDPPQSYSYGSSFPGYVDPSAPEPYRPPSTYGRISPFMGRVPSYRSTAYPRQGYPYDPDSKHRSRPSAASTDAYPQAYPPYIPPSYTYGPFPDKEKRDTSPPPDSPPNSPDAVSSSIHVTVPQSHDRPTTPEVPPPPSIRYVSGARPFPSPGLKLPLSSPTPSVLSDMQPTPNTIANTIANANIPPPTPSTISLRIDPGHRSTSRSSAYDSAPNTPERERDEDGERGRLLHSPHVHFVDPSTPSATSQGGGSASSIQTSFGHDLSPSDEALLSRRSSGARSSVVGDSPSTSALNPPIVARSGSKDTLNMALDALFQKNKKP